ncbi:PTS sugar transporter subunit IIA [Mycetocola tolaasinivorans]|uniref:Ascorbate-specific PTS system EIIA component n=1 Tax=Mycetocola tolaasinivorans TaxID=76635 RepID=A0A3L7A6K9_9MICO|nr:PTS sugar transporter subunit IIA [Mycetocola tolaasinivorans]RLP75949.1 PTS sugar transporter subunit IIA [Mycetocola tolaasinivorans]
MPLPPLPDAAINLHAGAGDWRGAVRLAGDALTEGGFTTEAYADRMIEVIEEFGAYVVIAPGLALAHARPGPDVLRSGIAVVTLAEPVVFGHPHNDPVNVLIGLAVTGTEEHVTTVAELANVFNNADSIPALAAAPTAERVREILGARAAE